MNEVKAFIVPLHSATYDEVLEIIYQNLPQQSDEKSNFIDLVHQLYFNTLYDGNMLKIGSRFCGFSIFKGSDPGKIELLVSSTDINREKIFGLLLNYHTQKFNLSPKMLEFSIWPHQSELLTFLHNLK